MHVLVPDSRIAKVLMDHVTTSKINLCAPMSSRMAYLSLKYTVTHQFHRGIVRFKPERCKQRLETSSRAIWLDSREDGLDYTT